MINLTDLLWCITFIMFISNHRIVGYQLWILLMPDIMFIKVTLYRKFTLCWYFCSVCQFLFLRCIKLRFSFFKRTVIIFNLRNLHLTLIFKSWLQIILSLIDDFWVNQLILWNVMVFILMITRWSQRAFFN